MHVIYHLLTQYFYNDLVYMCDLFYNVTCNAFRYRISHMRKRILRLYYL
jgi:hypothetical protein